MAPREGAVRASPYREEGLVDLVVATGFAFTQLVGQGAAADLGPKLHVGVHLGASCGSGRGGSPHPLRPQGCTVVRLIFSPPDCFTIPPPSAPATVRDCASTSSVSHSDATSSAIRRAMVVLSVSDCPLIQ